MAEGDPQFSDALAAPAPPIRRGARLRKAGAMLAVPLILVLGAAYYYHATDHYVSTDNAYVHQDKVVISGEVTGRIVEVAVRENQRVKAGDLLFRLDPEPYRIALAQADATIASAQVKVVGMETDLKTKSVDIDSATEAVRFFTEDYRRQTELMKRGFTTAARLQAAEHALAEARSQLATARADVAKSRAALANAPAAPGVNPAILAGQVEKRRAAYGLSRTEVRAPVSGVISQADRLMVGQLMIQGLPAVSIVASDRSWVEANFKETDLVKMRVGQPAALWFDAFPDVRLSGHVASIGAGTGAEFSVIPAQNASGNWVKVTQRVKVRIAIDGTPPRPLIAGLSTYVRVDTSR
ncbi:HlyD family secretion protein [uncultured Sphingomonas sp.]|uniref:HlyD family secretion protein n=1 Tax=uncultured Sphingomonas sp. TaxID=158754 RepID=UPI0035CC999C